LPDRTAWQAGFRVQKSLELFGIEKGGKFDNEVNYMFNL
jgi:hypothetical protein